MSLVIKSVNPLNTLIFTLVFRASIFYLRYQQTKELNLQVNLSFMFSNVIS